ncbi:11802_t:CDS:2, partial [Acaulospora colombiana]
MPRKTVVPRKGRLDHHPVCLKLPLAMRAVQFDVIRPNTDSSSTTIEYSECLNGLC